MESKNRNYGLSIVRLLAMIMIIICHVLQSQDYALRYYFNAGVYVFLFLSGFLYGQKEISDIAGFFKKQFLKLYIPYILVLIVIVSVNIITGNATSVKEIASSVLCLQWYGTSVPRCGHLWYVSCIIFCYALIPLLQYFAKSFTVVSVKNKWFIIATIVVILQLMNSFGAMPQTASEISCFVIAYLVAYWKLNESGFLNRGGYCYHY